MHTQPKSSFLRRALQSTAVVVLLSSPALAASLDGLVTSGLQNYPVEGASVQIPSLGVSETTQSDGTFRFVNIPDGDYEVIVSYVGTENITRNVSVSASTGHLAFVLDPKVDTVISVGQRANLLSALNQQRNADNLVSVITSDAMGQFADQNVTEAARRVSGISVENDQGEGRFIVIRGVDPNLNTTSINGVRIPAPEGDVRGAALDVIDAEVLKGIEITKSLTPDLDGDGIGGNVEIKTISAFDRKGGYLKAKAAGSYNEQVEEWSPKVSVSASDLFANDTVGLAVTASYRNRKFGSENYEVDGGFFGGDISDDPLYPEEFELRDYQVTRERINLAANFDYRPNNDHAFFIRTLYSDFTDEEIRSRVEIKLGEDDLPSQAGSNYTFAEGEVDRDIKDHTESQKVWSLSAGGESHFDDWTIDYSAALTHAEEGEPNRVDTDYRYGGDAFTADMTNSLRPVISFIDAGYLDASNYEFNGVEVTNGLTEDEESAFEINARRDMNFGSNPGYIKFGAKARLRDKSRDVDLDVYDDDDSYNLGQVLGAVDYSPFNIGPVGDPALIRQFVSQNLSSLKLKADDTFIESNLADYTASENIIAGYVMAGIDINRLRAVGGVRIESTDYEGEGRDVRLFEKKGTLDLASLPMGASCIDGDGAAVTPVAGVLGDDLICVGTANNEDSYTDVLPSLVLRYEATDKLLLRGSYYKSLARPNFGAIVPAASIESNDDNDYEGSFGNVTSLGIKKLEHQTADSFDASAEYYTDNGGVISVGVFYKDFTDFIATFKDEDFKTSFATFDQATYAINLPKASLLGFEFNVQQSLTFLPGAASGLLVGFNYTNIDGEAEYVDGTVIEMPKQSDNIMNAVVGYDKYGLDLRLAYAYRSEYLDEVGGRYIDDHGQWDFTAKYKINDNFRIFGEISNLNNEPFVAFDKDGNSKSLSQYEEYGRTFEIGLQYKY